MMKKKFGLPGARCLGPKMATESQEGPKSGTVMQSVLKTIKLRAVGNHWHFQLTWLDLLFKIPSSYKVGRLGCRERWPGQRCLQVYKLWCRPGLRDWQRGKSALIPEALGDVSGICESWEEGSKKKWKCNDYFIFHIIEWMFSLP